MKALTRSERETYRRRYYSLVTLTPLIGLPPGLDEARREFQDALLAPWPVEGVL